MRDDPEVRQAAGTYQLGLPRMPSSGRAGELLGRGAGSSLEFQEYREYVPGDDIRHLDWAAYARSDTLMVRLYREEISPRTEIFCDASRSMTSGDPSAGGEAGSPQKHRLARQLAGLFAMLSAHLGGRPAVVPLDDRRPLQQLTLDDLSQLASLPFDGTSTLTDLVNDRQLPLGRQSVRIVISDFLFPHNPDSLVRQLAAGASALWIIQLLNAWEADPTPIGGRRLIDMETTAEADLLVNHAAIEAYRSRLARLQQSLTRASRRAHAVFTTLIAEEGLERLS